MLPAASIVLTQTSAAAPMLLSFWKAAGERLFNLSLQA